MINAQQPMIHLEDMTKVFLTDEIETHALSNLTLDIQPGEYVSIAGPSGCRKLTLLSILGLLDTPSEGTYILNGKSMCLDRQICSSPATGPNPSLAPD